METKKCGCYAVPVNNSQEFYYCPLHEAARDLLAACEAAHIQMIALGNALNWDDIPKEYADAINLIRDAKAKAKGE